MRNATDTQTTSHYHDDAIPPATAPADPLALLKGPAAMIFSHDGLSLAAKGLAVYVLLQPRGRLFTRAEFERLSRDGAQLDGALHELARACLLVPFPIAEPPCRAVAFGLRDDP
jgi:hypothetical protein